MGHPGASAPPARRAAPAAASPSGTLPAMIVAPAHNVPSPAVPAGSSELPGLARIVGQVVGLYERAARAPIPNYLTRARDLSELLPSVLRRIETRPDVTRQVLDGVALLRSSVPRANALIGQLLELEPPLEPRPQLAALRAEVATLQDTAAMLAT